MATRTSMNEDLDPWPWTLEVISAYPGHAGWCVLRDAAGGLVSGDCVEGPRREFEALARDLERGLPTAGFRRVRTVLFADRVKFFSPRNRTTAGRVASLPRDRVPALVAVIRRALAWIPDGGPA